MTQRNDASAVTKAARAVSRPVAEALIRLRLGARLPKLVAQPAQLQPEPRIAPPIGSPESGFGDDGELRLPSSSGFGGASTGTRRRGRAAPRRNANLDYRKVRVARGSMPRYGTKRFDKAQTVRSALNDAADGFLYVWQLVGRHYDTSKDTLTLHDLDVMVEKHLITMEGDTK